MVICMSNASMKRCKEVVKKIKVDVDRLLLIFTFEKNEKKFNFRKIYPKKISIITTKSSLSASVFIFSFIFQILRAKFQVFWTKTCTNLAKCFTWTFYFFQVSHALNIRGICKSRPLVSYFLLKVEKNPLICWKTFFPGEK